MRYLLKGDGYPCHEASTGADALGYMANHTPCVVILDHGLPDMTGFDVLRSMKADARLANVPVIVFSANPFVEDEAMQLGATQFVLKSSLDWVALIAFIRNACGPSKQMPVGPPPPRRDPQVDELPERQKKAT